MRPELSVRMGLLHKHCAHLPIPGEDFSDLVLRGQLGIDGECNKEGCAILVSQVVARHISNYLRSLSVV